MYPLTMHYSVNFKKFSIGSILNGILIQYFVRTYYSVQRMFVVYATKVYDTI